MYPENNVGLCFHGGCCGADVRRTQRHLRDKNFAFAEIPICLGGGLGNARSSACTSLFSDAPCSVCSEVMSYCDSGKYAVHI